MEYLRKDCINQVDNTNQEYVYCAINKNGVIQDIHGSSKRTRYFKTIKYLKHEIEYHNKYYPDDKYRIALFKFKCIDVIDV